VAQQELGQGAQPAVVFEQYLRRIGEQLLAG
jgi:hypothetical protein